jgi:membrane-associated protease RseP (regulator of RpoE activity)
VKGLQEVAAAAYKSARRGNCIATSTVDGERLAPAPYKNIRLTLLSLIAKIGWLRLLLLLLSLLTTCASGARFMRNFQLGLPPLSSLSDFFPFPLIWRHPELLLRGWSFSLTLLSILLAHEAGHYFYCRKHGIQASLPLILPAPTLSGTFGAVIRVRSPIPSREALIEVGIAGPIAGYAVALPAAILGLYLSKPATLRFFSGLLQFHMPATIVLLNHLYKALVPGFPEGARLLPHPVLLASWIGFFITSLNLIPAGQLDGGHILYAISPRWHRWMTFAIPVILLGMGLAFWSGWLVWGAILFLPAMRHPRTPLFPPLSRKHIWLGVIALALLALTMLPAPFADAGLIARLR